jgi:integrase
MTTTFKDGLGKHPNGFFHYCFRIEGKQFKGSTRTKEFSSARKILDQKRWEARNPDSPSTEQIAEVVPTQDQPEEASEAPGTIPTLQKTLDEWLILNRTTMSFAHIKAVKGAAKKWLKSLLAIPVDQIRAADILRIRGEMLDVGLSPSSANHVGRIASLLCNFAVTVGYIEKHPFKVKLLRVQKKPRPFLSASKVHEFLAAIDKEAENHHIKVLIRILLGLGLRESEALNMRWEWLDADHRTYVVGRAKGKEARVLPVPDWLWTAIRSVKKTKSPWMFPAADGLPHRPQFLKKALRRVCKTLKLGNLTPHRMRSSFATLHAEAGTPLTSLQGMMGHKSITTTMIYVEQTLESKRKAQDALSQKLGFV